MDYKQKLTTISKNLLIVDPILNTDISVRVGLVMYPGIYPFNPLGWVFFCKKQTVFFFVESVFFDKTFIIFYNNSSYYTIEVANG